MRSNIRSQQQDDSNYKKISSEVNEDSASDEPSSDHDDVESQHNGHMHENITTNTNDTNFTCETARQTTEMVPITTKNTESSPIATEYKQEEIIIAISQNEEEESPLQQNEEKQALFSIVTAEIQQQIQPDETDSDSDTNTNNNISSVSDSDNDNISIGNGNINENKNVLLGMSSVIGNTYNNTETFNDKIYFEQNQFNLSRIHLCCVKYWQTNALLLGIQCEWDLYNDDGIVVQKLSSQINYNEHMQQNEPELCFLDFGNYLYHPIIIKQDEECIHSISLMSQFGANGKSYPKEFGGSGGTDNVVILPLENIVIGFCGGYAQSMHNLGVISIPYNQGVGYDLSKSFFKQYEPQLDDEIVECILDYTFYVNFDDMEAFGSVNIELEQVDNDHDMEQVNEEEEITWEQPRQNARGTCISMENYTDKQAMEDAKIIRQALRGIDDHNLLEITGHRSTKQRIMIKNQYKILFEEKQHDLLADIEKELSGVCGQLFCTCYLDIGELDAQLIYKAISGDKVDKYLLNEILCTRTNNEINLMKTAWNELGMDYKAWINNRSMEECVATVIDEEKKNNDMYKELLIGLLNGDRFANKKVMISNIREYAEMLSKDKRKRRRNQKQLCEILSTWSWSKIGALCAEFNTVGNNSQSVCDVIHEMFDDSVSDERDALCVIVKFCENPYEFWSSKIKDSMSGIGTDNNMLIRCIVSRCETDLYQIRETFDEKYSDGATLKEWIENETTGFYQELLLILCGYDTTNQEIVVVDENKNKEQLAVFNEYIKSQNDHDTTTDENTTTTTATDDNTVEINDITEENTENIDDIKIDDLAMLNHPMKEIKEETDENDSSDHNEEDVLSEISEEEEEEEEEEDEDDEEKIDDIEQYKDMPEEHIENLLKMKIRKSFENVYLLGDRTTYKIPKKEREYVHLERDLRRLTRGFKNVEFDDRKYCKLVILKHFSILNETFKRYCLIGGDRHWLTPKGWRNLYKDSFVCDSKSEYCNVNTCKELYDIILSVHDNKKHSKNIESDWNGIWKKGHEDVIVKIKQMSDYKLKGFIKSFDFCDINGVIKHETKNKKTKKFIIFYHQKTDENKPMKCDATLINENKIKIEFETIQESAKKNDEEKTEKGIFILNKTGELTKEDNILFKSVYGLLRYEYFDMLLRLSQMKFETQKTHDYKFQSLLKLIQDFIIPFIWDDIKSVNASKDSFKWLFKKDSKSLHKLFNNYSSENKGLLNEEEWNLLCKNLINKDIISDAFKKGGKPTKADIYQSFQLAKVQLYHLNLTYSQFEKALQIFAHKIYKKKPKSKYNKFNYQDKLKKVLEWAVKLQQLNDK